MFNEILVCVLPWDLMFDSTKALKVHCPVWAEFITIHDWLRGTLLQLAPQLGTPLFFSL